MTDPLTALLTAPLTGTSRATRRVHLTTWPRGLALVSATLLACAPGVCSGGVDVGAADEALRARPAPPARPELAADAEAWAKHLAGLTVDELGPDRAIRRPGIQLPPVSRPSLLALFSTTCAPCLQEMPMLEALARDGYAIRGLSLDTGSLPELAGVLEARDVTYPIYVVTAAALPALGRAADGLPLTLALDAAGHVREAHRGRLDREGALAGLARVARAR